MSWILLTNDDGIESRALGPFARALGRLDEVRVVVPDTDHSWIGKAVTGRGVITVADDDRLGVTTLTVSGYPADAVQIAAVAFDTPPSLVVSGINRGYNHGAGYVMTSGTVGAAIEGWELSIPAYAFSAGREGDWDEWLTHATSPGSDPTWTRLAGLCAGLVEEFRSVDLVGDVVNVNVPWDADRGTPRRVTTIARTAYGQILRQVDGGAGFECIFQDTFTQLGPLEGTDVAANAEGAIAITPMMMPQAPPVPDEVRQLLEQG